MLEKQLLYFSFTVQRPFLQISHKFLIENSFPGGDGSALVSIPENVNSAPDKALASLSEYFCNNTDDIPDCKDKTAIDRTMSTFQIAMLFQSGHLDILIRVPDKTDHVKCFFYDADDNFLGNTDNFTVIACDDGQVKLYGKLNSD